MTIQEAGQQLVRRLREIYTDSEAENISSWTIEHITGLDRKSRINDQAGDLTMQQTEQLEFLHEIIPNKVRYGDIL